MCRSVCVSHGLPGRIDERVTRVLGATGRDVPLAERGAADAAGGGAGACDLGRGGADRGTSRVAGRSALGAAGAVAAVGCGCGWVSATVYSRVVTAAGLVTHLVLRFLRLEGQVLADVVHPSQCLLQLPRTRFAQFGGRKAEQGCAVYSRYVHEDGVDIGGGAPGSSRQAHADLRGLEVAEVLLELFPRERQRYARELVADAKTDLKKSVDPSAVYELGGR